jgi:hypothetical protein
VSVVLLALLEDINMCSEHISWIAGYAKLRGFWKEVQNCTFWGIKNKTFPLSELVKIY